MSPLGKPLAVLALSLSAPAFGQATVYEAGFGTGGFDSGNQSATALQVPLSFRLREREEYGWGLRLRVPVTFGVTDFDEDGLQAVEDIKTLSVVATAELDIPLDETWSLIPSSPDWAPHTSSSRARRSGWASGA